MASNSFAAAIKATTNYVRGDNGALMHKTSGDSRVDCFTNFSKDTSEDRIKAGISNMIAEIASQPTAELRGEAIADIFRLWQHKRHAREGEKEKILSYRYFLELYNHYPRTCIEIAASGLYGEIGYWKDYILIWGMIIDMDMDTEAKFRKYNPLIEAFRRAMLSQRNKDLKALDAFVTPNNISRISKAQFIELITAEDAQPPQISYVGKYVVREKSKANKTIGWWIRDEKTGILKFQTNVSYMLRGALKVKDGNGGYAPYPLYKDVPYGAKETYRQLNAKLNERLDVPENKMCAHRWDEMNPEKFPSMFMKKTAKALLNEKLKKSPSGSYEEEYGNRYPENEQRVGLRKRMREMFCDPSRVNAKQIFPHEIAYNSTKATSTANKEMQQALWDSKCLDTLEELKVTREKIAAEIENAGGANMSMAVRKALTSGNFIGCADVSASMTWVDKPPNQPLNIAWVLHAFFLRLPLHI